MIYKKSRNGLVFLFILSILLISACGPIDRLLDPAGSVVQTYDSCVQDFSGLAGNISDADKFCASSLSPREAEILCERRAVNCPTETQDLAENTVESSQIEDESTDDESSYTAVEHNNQLLYNGIYQFTSNEGWTNYLQFYENGVVITVFSNNASADEVAGWFRDGHESPVSGNYSIEGNTIQILIPSPEISLQYNGAVLDNGLDLSIAGDLEELYNGVYQYSEND